MERESVNLLKDFHEHQPLELDEEPWDESNLLLCPVCKDLLTDEIYRCENCWFLLHKRCAEAPSEANDLPVCLEHSCLFLNVGVPFPGCFFCRVSGDEDYFYSCYGTGEGFDLCMKCAFFMLDNSSDNNEKLQLDYHPHPLLVVANHKDELRRIECDACKEALSDSICVCFDCGFFLHKKCTHPFSLEINHPCHRRHPLSLHLQKKNSPQCEICRENFHGLSYGCSSCKFYIHLKCAELGSFNNVADETHQHTFNLVWRQGSFLCNACGTEGHYSCNVCSQCHINVHKKCTSLPRLIRITRHPDHTISHSYFVKENCLDQKLDCKICYNEVKKEYGCYCCSREDCNYIADVNCAIGKGDYRIVNADDPEEPVEESFQIIEKNDNGEVVKIKHFCHDHYLMLGKENNQSDDKCCDGCMLFLSGLFYYCSQCDFFLHKTCAELPRKKRHWFNPNPTTLELASPFLMTRQEGSDLQQASLLRCQYCYQWGNGLFYCYKGNDRFSRDLMIVCLRCTSLPDALVHPGHEHRIHWDSDYKRECGGCGTYRSIRGAFRCKECDNYSLDFKCMTLPIEARHKCDKHLLRLAYHDENKDPEKHYCDVCEQKRDPNRWFYLCSICDNSAHPKCVLGEYPFIKIGTTLEKRSVHPHPLTFVNKVYYYPECSICGKHCLGLALECAQSECNYIVHLKCLRVLFIPDVFLSIH